MTQHAERPPTERIAILGGTGDQGRGLARRLSLAGVQVVLGSRDASRAQEAAATLPDGVTGADNHTAASSADVVIVATPWAGHESTLRELSTVLEGRIVIDCVNPLGFDKLGAFALAVPEGSAAQQAAALLPGSTVVAAFHHLSAVLLLDPDVEDIHTDVLVLGDDRAATDVVCALADRVPGMRGIFAGRLRNAHQVEAMTANLISVNRRYKAHAGLRVTDV
jgi:NADPH-dependent F420 reductase